LRAARRPRTPMDSRQRSRFKTGFAAAVAEVLGELRRLGRITPPTTMGCARTLRSTRILRSIALRRQSGVSHQQLGSAVSITPVDRIRDGGYDRALHRLERIAGVRSGWQRAATAKNKLSIIFESGARIASEGRPAPLIRLKRCERQGSSPRDASRRPRGRVQADASAVVELHPQRVNRGKFRIY
jgi:hypothetical protein